MPPKRQKTAFSEELEIITVGEIERRPVLWDSTLEIYRRADLKLVAFEEVASALHTPGITGKYCIVLSVLCLFAGLIGIKLISELSTTVVEVKTPGVLHSFRFCSCSVSFILTFFFKGKIVADRWKSMRSTFMENERRIREFKNKCSGSGTDDVYVPTWVLYKHLLFLKKASVQATSTSNLDSRPNTIEDSTSTVNFPQIYFDNNLRVSNQ